MKKLRFTLFAWVVLFALNGCIEDPKTETGVIGAKEPEFESFGKENVSERTASSIQVTATISTANGEKITERGFLFGTSTPLTEANGTMVSDTKTDNLVGSYTMTLDKLDNNTRYYIRPYATNAKGTNYGDEIDITTNKGTAIIEIIHPTLFVTRATTAKIGMTITDAGEGKIHKMGVYVFEKNNMANKDTAIFVYDTVYPLQIAYGKIFDCPIKDLTPATDYYVQAFVTNEYGTTFGIIDSLRTLDGKPSFGLIEIESKYTSVTLKSSVTDKGDETVTITERGFCWDETANADLSKHKVRCGEGTGTFNGTIEGLDSNKKYYARAYAIIDLGNGLPLITEYGDEIPIETMQDRPTVRTEAVTNIQNGNADVKGVIDNEGMNSVIASGICWSATNPEPNMSDYFLPLTAGTGGVFSGQLTGLRGGLIYHVRAYARNSQGTAYGDVVSFSTPAVFTEGLATFTGSLRWPNSMAYFAIDGDLYILGGDLGASYTNELWRYSTAMNYWQQLQAFSGGPAMWQFGIRYGWGAFVYGGYNGSGTETVDIYQYNAKENLWSYSPGPSDSAIVSRTTGYSINNNVFFIGGKSADTVRQDVWSYEAASKVWQRKTDFPVKQYGGVAFVIDGTAYAGLGNDINDVCNESLWATADGALSWNPVSSSYPTITGSVLGGVVCNNRLYIIDESYYILEYNPATNVWTRKSQLSPARRHFHCIFSENNKIYIGMGQSGNSLMIYDPVWDNELY